MEETIQAIRSLAASFQESLQIYIPALAQEVKELIDERSKDVQKIEYCLDTLLSVTGVGIGDELFIQLVEYYKTVDEEGAAYYWAEYDADDENIGEL